MKQVLVYGAKWNPETLVTKTALDENNIDYTYEEYSGTVNTTLPIVIVVDGEALEFESVGLLTGKKIEEIKEKLK